MASITVHVNDNASDYVVEFLHANPKSLVAFVIVYEGNRTGGLDEVPQSGHKAENVDEFTDHERHIIGLATLKASAIPSTEQGIFEEILEEDVTYLDEDDQPIRIEEAPEDEEEYIRWLADISGTNTDG